MASRLGSHRHQQGGCLEHRRPIPVAAHLPDLDSAWEPTACHQCLETFPTRTSIPLDACVISGPGPDLDLEPNFLAAAVGAGGEGSRLWLAGGASPP